MVFGAEYGIIGKVIDVTDTSSTVSLLSANNENSKVAIRIAVAPGEFVFGILESYDDDTGLFNVNLLESSDKIMAGQAITNSS